MLSQYPNYAASSLIAYIKQNQLEGTQKKSLRRFTENGCNMEKNESQLTTSTNNLQPVRQNPLNNFEFSNLRLKKQSLELIKNAGNLDFKSQSTSHKDRIQETQKTKLSEGKLRRMAHLRTESKENLNMNYEEMIRQTVAPSSYVRKEKVRQKAIREFTHSIEELERFQKKKKENVEFEEVDAISQTPDYHKVKKQNMIYIDNFVLYGEQPRWRQFESLRRIRYKITIRGYNKKKNITEGMIY